MDFGPAKDTSGYRALRRPGGSGEAGGAGLGLRFLGIGGGTSQGSPIAVLESDAEPLLMIDCGPGATDRFRDQYGGLPAAVYLSHTHMDHIGGLEQLFHEAAPLVATGAAAPVRLFVPASIVPGLQEKVHCHAYARAEGGVNFWDAFQVIPVSAGFWLHKRWFRVFEVRHMQPRFCYGIALPGCFVFTADTRPIPEVLREVAAEGETIFHDCAVRANPAHSGFVDLLHEYGNDLLDRIVAYHYGTIENGRRLEQHGFRIAKLGRRHALTPAGQEAVAARLAC